MEASIKKDLGEELYSACKDGDLDAVLNYLADQRSISPIRKPHWSAMMCIAAIKDHSAIVQYCLDNGGEVTDSLMKEILINRARDTYKLLIDSKAVSVDYYIPWFGDILSNVVTDDDMEWATLCLECGADPNRNLVDEHKTILAAAAEMASVEMVSLLLKNGAHLKGSGAIVLAAQEGKVEMVRFLLEQGADINEIGIEHPTDERVTAEMGSALHKAVQGEHTEVVQLLLEKGADAMLKDAKRRLPSDFEEARRNGKIQMLLKNRLRLK